MLFYTVTTTLDAICLLQDMPNNVVSATDHPGTGGK